MTHVFQPSYEDFLEIYELRLAVEPYTAKIASKRIGPEGLAILERNIEKTADCLQTGNGNELVVLNHEFHSQIWLESGNKRFYEILENVSSLSHYYLLSVFHLNSEQSNVIAEHRAIYEALRKQDAEMAYEAMTRNIVKDLAKIQTAYKSETEKSEIEKSDS